MKVSAILLCLVLLYACGSRMSEDTRPTSKEEALLSVAETLSVVSQPDVEEEYTPEVDFPYNVRGAEAYKKLIEGFMKEKVDGFHIKGDYCLYDITRDGQPELWLKAGTCEANYTLYVYTYRHGKAVKLFKNVADHATFYQGHNYIVQTMTHMGVNDWYKITYRDGKLKKRLIYHKQLAEDEDFELPKEALIEVTEY